MLLDADRWNSVMEAPRRIKANFMVVDLDAFYGECRSPAPTNGDHAMQAWEIGKEPVSRIVFGPAAATAMKKLCDVANTAFFGFAVSTINYIWVVNEAGDLVISVEELAVEDAVRASGLPRRRSGHHPAEVKKLGHPTLIAGGLARIAGELALDRVNGIDFTWVLNANSGRYCRFQPPSKVNLENVRNVLRSHGLEVHVDDSDTAG